MAVITPQSDVYLLKVPLEIDDINQLTFSNATAQHNYFNSLPKIGVENFTYQRKDGTIRYGASFDSLIEYNYVMYRNDAYSNKWFYAFITGMEYLNDNVTAISIRTDVWQTWQFQLTFKPVLVDREHTNNDTIGVNTIPENLELGEMVVNGNVTNFGINATGIGDYCLIVDVSMIENPGTNQTLTYSWVTGSTPPQYVNGIPSGVYHLILGYNSSVTISARDVIDIYDKAGLSDAIQNVYILPTALLGEVQFGLTLTTTGSAPAASVGGLAMPKFSQGATSIGTFTTTRPSAVNGYTPKNNKLLCYPYNYLNVSNNAGATQPYRYEDFSGNISFLVEGALCPSGSVKAIPQNYKNISPSENGYDYSITGAKYPICGWISDSYTNWLTQNAVNMDMQYIRGALNLIPNMIGSMWSVGTSTGSAGAAAVAGGLSAAMSLGDIALQQHQAKSEANLTPDQAKGNQNAGDVVWAKHRSKFTFLPMSIKAEYARCIDEYFSQYGYKCNRVKVPNITGRRNWNYVKTIGCYIDADIPQDDLHEIKSMFDKGITLWHNPSTFADYSQNNDII